MDSFSLLSPTMQKKIWDMGWESFTDIQDKTIPLVIETSKDLIISSGTASGKTEATFLPVLSLIEHEASEQLKVLYISPLKALINNQFERIQDLCTQLDISIHRWHGDVSQSEKKKLIKQPTGILQITPESIESLFINRTEHLTRLFSNLSFVIIDEIHAFLDNERGVQLRSLLTRLTPFCKQKPRILGLSATIDNFEFVKKWVNYTQKENVEIIESKGSNKELFYHLMHIPMGEDGKTPLFLFEDIRGLTQDKQSIIFCNARGSVEETTVFLNRLAAKEGVGETYYAHHSSVDKKERAFVEETLAHSTSPKSVVATSSLELGIDIGKIDLVIQVNSTFSVSSLKQRLGRSGRTKDAAQYLQLYTTEKDQLLQSLAVIDLLLDSWVEPSTGYALPYDIAFHQLLSICHQTNGITLNELIKTLHQNDAFHVLSRSTIQTLIEHMVSADFLERIKGSNELIVGLEGERILRSRDFYPVFATSEEYMVTDGAKNIGQLDKKFNVMVGDNIMLAGKLWTIQDIDHKRNKIYVTKSLNAKKPKYYGDGGKLHPILVEKMFTILTEPQQYEFMDEQAKEALEESRKRYRMYRFSSQERPIWKTHKEYEIETFTGTNIVNTLTWMLRYFGVETGSRDSIGRIDIKETEGVNLLSVFEQIKKKEWKAEELFPYISENEWFASKYSLFLPLSLQQEMHVAHEMDLEGTLNFLDHHTFRLVKE